MSLHQLFPVTRPALAPILFPFGADDLLWDRATSDAILVHVVRHTRLPYRLAAKQAAWGVRLNARIAQVVS